MAEMELEDVGREKPMKLITVKMPTMLLEEIDRLVKMGMFANRSEVIRTAVKWFIAREVKEAHKRVSLDLPAPRRTSAYTLVPLSLTDTLRQQLEQLRRSIEAIERELAPKV